MKQDQIIKWLMDNVDAEALARANEDGSTIMYFAGVAQRWPNNTQTVTNPRVRNTTTAPRTVVAERQTHQQAVDLNIQNETQTEAPAPARPAPRRAARANPQGDIVRVGTY